LAHGFSGDSSVFFLEAFDVRVVYYRPRRPMAQAVWGGSDCGRASHSRRPFLGWTAFGRGNDDLSFSSRPQGRLRKRVLSRENIPQAVFLSDKYPSAHERAESVVFVRLLL